MHCKQPIHAALACFLTVTATPAVGSDLLTYSGTIGFTIESFNYDEKDENDRRIDSEDGALPGLFLNLQARSGHWFIAGEFHILQGEVDYTAYPADTELKSRTSENIKDLSLTFGFSQDLNASTQLEYSGGLGLRNWERDIHSLPGIPGLDETYDWPYLSLAIKPVIQMNPGNSVTLLLRAKQAFDATLDVKFKDGLHDQVKLDLDNGRGLELEVTWFYEKSPTTSIGLGPYLHFWWFDESDQFTLTENGTPVGTVHEPASDTRSLGFRLFIRKYF